jgi:hypothetical protein
VEPIAISRGRERLAAAGWAALAFGTVFAVFIIAPPFIKAPFAPFPLLGWADIVDLFTPFAILPLAWGLAVLAAPGRPSLALILGLGAATVLWAQGQGMHLGANAIGHLVDESHGADLARLVELLDEELSHLIWHAGVIGLAALTLGRELRAPIGPIAPLGSWLASVAGGVLFGATFFMMFVEGRTAIIGVPAAAALGLIPFLIRRRQLERLPVASFTVTGCLLALGLAIAWFVINGGTLPEFSELGII